MHVVPTKKPYALPFSPNRMVDFNSVQNSRDCRADKSQIARSRIGPLQNAKQAFIFCFEFSNVLF